MSHRSQILLDLFTTSRHLQSTSGFKYCVYYGKDRHQHLKRIEDYALIITTYSVVRIDWKASLGGSDVGPNLYSSIWERLVLDEGKILQYHFQHELISVAHIIREPSKSFAKSVCALQAERRWAVTGTPIQNRLMDLYSLFKFLQAYPFNDPRTFSSEVTEKWKARSDPECVAKFISLVNCLSLRRPKETIDLPARQDQTTLVDFTDEERRHYERVRDSTSQRIDSAYQDKQGPAFLNALKWVNELRSLCNHGLVNDKILRASEQVANTAALWNQQEAQSNFDRLDKAGLAQCSNIGCGQDLSSISTDEDHCDEPSISETLELLCSSCAANSHVNPAGFLKICNHQPRRAVEGPVLSDTGERHGRDKKFSIAQGQEL